MMNSGLFYCMKTGQQLTAKVLYSDRLQVYIIAPDCLRRLAKRFNCDFKDIASVDFVCAYKTPSAFRNKSRCIYYLPEMPDLYDESACKKMMKMSEVFYNNVLEER